MICPKCQTELPADAKFCIECGASVEQANQCSNCGEAVKDDARFCHNCGEAVSPPEGTRVKAEAADDNVEAGTQQSWLNQYGAFLFLPIFAGIVVLLFWVNREPEPVNANANVDQTSSQQNEAPSMAMMQDVHNTLERLKERVAEDSTDVVAMDSLAMMYSIAGSNDKARKYYHMQRRYYERQLQQNPGNNSIKVELAKSYYATQNTRQAIDLLNEVLSEEPTHAFALFYLASIHEQLQHKEMAGDLWQKIVDNYPGTEMAQVAEQRIHELTHE